MPVSPTPYGTYIARWTDPWGNQKSKTLKTRAAADAYYKRMLGDIARGEYVDPARARIRLADWADDWLAGARNLSTGGRDTYRRDLDRYILPKLGRVQVGKLTASHIDRYLNDLTLAPSSVHRHYRTLHRMLEVARLRGLVARNPADLVIPPTVPRRERPMLDVLQIEALASTIAPRYRAWVYVMCYGGLRWSEAVGLRRMDVQTSEDPAMSTGSSRGVFVTAGPIPLTTNHTRLVVASQLVHRGPGQWERIAPKTHKARSVTLPDFAAGELAAHLHEFSAPGPEGLVFPTRNGTPVQSPSFTANVFKRALRKAGLPDMRIHDLRHTAVSLGIEAGIPVKANQERAGHASSSLHLDVYGHRYPAADAQAAVMLSDLRTKALRGRLRAV